MALISHQHQGPSAEAMTFPRRFSGNLLEQLFFFSSTVVPEHWPIEIHMFLCILFLLYSVEPFIACILLV